MCNYNASVALWKDYPKGTRVRLQDGMLLHREAGWVARFTDDAHARRMLEEAGWSRISLDAETPETYEKDYLP